MPRPEKPLEPDGSALVEFAVGLRRLREAAGSPPYRELAGRTHYSASTLSDAAGGRRLPSLAVAVAYVRACGADVGEWEQRWHEVAVETVRAGRLAASSSDGTDDDTAPGDAPYMGLTAYQAGDARWFCGRDRLVDHLVAQVRKRRFTAVFGPSGSGKSSVLRAGLQPRLTAGSSSVVVFTPGADPFDECAAHLARLLGGTAGAVRAELVADPRNLHRLALQALAAGPVTAELVLVVDQFEELFTLCRDQEVRSRFIAALIDAARVEPSRCRVVLGVRSDFYTHCVLDPELGAALDEAQVAVGPMTVDELRRAIVHPARRARCVIENALLAALIAQTHGRPGALPLLSHALRETWKHRQGATLSLAGFQRTGGIDAALATTADDVFDALDANRQHLAKTLLVRLVALGDGTDDTKRRIARMELDHDEDIAVVLERLTAARLLVVSDNSVELAHETLISAWPRLRRWLAEDREAHRVHRELTEAALTWQQHRRDPDTLLRGARLDLAAHWAQHHTGANRLETEFLNASTAAEQDRRRTLRRRSRVLQGLVTVLAVLLLVAAGTAVYAIDAQRTAIRQRDAATSLRILDNARLKFTTAPREAALLSLAAYRLNPSGMAAELLLTAAGAAAAGKWNRAACACEVVLAPDDRRAAGWSKDRDRTTLSLIQPAALTEIGAVPGGAAAPVFSRDGGLLATLDHEGAVRLWDLSDPVRPRQSATLPGTHSSIRFSPDGKVLLTVDAVAVPASEPAAQPGKPAWAPGTTARLWSTEDAYRPEQLGTLPGSPALLDVDSDRHLILTHDTPVTAGAPLSRITMWDYSNATAPRALGVVTDTTNVRPTAVAHSDGVIIAGTAGEGSLYGWRVDRPEMPPFLMATPPAWVKGVRDLALDPTRHRVVTTDLDGHIALWKLVDLPAATGAPDPARPRRLHQDFQSSPNRTSYRDVEFAVDGRVIQGVDPEDDPASIHQWWLDPEEAAAALCAGGQLSEGEWNLLLSDAPYHRQCDDPAPRPGR